MKPSQNLPKSLRPSSTKTFESKDKKVMHVQTLQFQVEEQQKETQPTSQVKQIKKVQLAKTGIINVEKPKSPENQFDQFMQQKMQNNSELKRQYQGSSSKPFSIQKQKTIDDDSKSQVSAQTEFTMNSQNSKKPYAQFYKNFKNYDTHTPSRGQFKRSEVSEDFQNDQPNKKQEQVDTYANPSFASTDKSFEIQNEKNSEFDTVSLSQSQRSDRPSSNNSNVEQQNFRQFVKMKKQKAVLVEVVEDQQKQKTEIIEDQQPNQELLQQQELNQINFRGWTVHEQGPLPTRLQTRQYQSIAENFEQIVEDSSQRRGQYLKELNSYVKGLDQAIDKDKQKQSTKTKKEKNTSKLSTEEQKQLENEIKKLAKQLKQKETERFEKISIMTLKSLHSIAEEPLENLSNMTSSAIRDRSLFITDMLKNRSLFQTTLQNQEEEIKDDELQILNTSQLSEMLAQLEADMEKDQKQKQLQKPPNLPRELQDRLDWLTENMDIPSEQLFDRTPFDMFKDPQSKLKWDQLHIQIRGHNRNYNEFDSLELHNDALPRDKTLREEALKRYIRTKQQYVNKGLMENAEKQSEGTMEDKFKIQDLVASLNDSLAKGNIMLGKKATNNEEEQERQLQFEELLHLENEAKQTLAKFNAQVMFQEIEEMKKNLDQAIDLSKQIQNDIRSDPKYQFAEELIVKKQALDVLMAEVNDLGQRSEAVFRLEEFLSTFKREEGLPIFQDHNEQILFNPISRLIQDDPVYEQKTIEDYDFQITEKARFLNPELFN